MRPNQLNNPFGNPYIASTSLAASDVPPDASDWRAIIEFAATLDQTAEPPTGAKVRGVADITADSSILDMRYAWFAEWRRWNHIGRRPDSDVTELAQNVLELLRSNVA